MNSENTNLVRIEHMDTKFILAMVRSLYDWEAAQIDCPNLCNESEMQEFYMAYMGCPL